MRIHSARVPCLFLTAAAIVALLTVAGGRAGGSNHPAHEGAAGQEPARRDPLLRPVDTATVYVGLLRKDALLVHVFAYRRDGWTKWPYSVPVPQGWTLYGYDGSVRSLRVGVAQGISDDDYDFWGYKTDYPVDTTKWYIFPRPRVGVAATAPARPYPLLPLDSASAEWGEIAQASLSAFEEREQRAVADLFAQALCAHVPPGADCDVESERRRLEADGRLPRGHPIDSAQRARGTVAEFVILGTAPLPGGLTLYHASFERWYRARNPSGYCAPVSYFSANVVRRAARLKVTDAGVTLSDCDGKGRSGVEPRALLFLGGRVYVLAETWAWEEGYPVVRELSDTGLVNTPDPGLRN